MPLRRMNAITTSMRSAEWTSARTGCRPWALPGRSSAASCRAEESAAAGSPRGFHRAADPRSRAGRSRRSASASRSAWLAPICCKRRSTSSTPGLHALGLGNVLEGLLHRASHVQRNAVRGLGGSQGLADRLQAVRQLRQQFGERLREEQS